MPPVFRGEIHQDHVSLSVVAAMTIGTSFALIWALPGVLVLPALGILLILFSGCTALVAFAAGSDRNAAGFSIWDAAGAFAFLGCGAAMLSEPAQFLPLLEGQLAHLADPFPRDPPN